jgi:hypothetical protein
MCFLPVTFLDQWNLSINIERCKTASEIERMEEHPGGINVRVKSRYLPWKIYLTDAPDVQRV